MNSWNLEFLNNLFRQLSIYKAPSIKLYLLSALLKWCSLSLSNKRSSSVQVKTEKTCKLAHRQRRHNPGSTVSIHFWRYSTSIIHASTLFDVYYPCFAVIDYFSATTWLKSIAGNEAQSFYLSILALKSSHFYLCHRRNRHNSIHVIVEASKVVAVFGVNYLCFDVFRRCSPMD